jgi:hypothetical protein
MFLSPQPLWKNRCDVLFTSPAPMKTAPHEYLTMFIRRKGLTLSVSVSTTGLPHSKQ